MEQEQIKNLILELIQKMGISIESIEVSELKGQNIFSIQTKESALLIGKNGETLRSLNTLVRKIVDSKSLAEKEEKLSVDVNGYQKQKIQKIESQAKTLAERARTLKCDVEMSPMSSYERMIVHEALRGEQNIKTESKGEGSLRRTIISYKEN